MTGFTYDGDAPAAYWWGAPSTDNGDIRGSGRRIAEMRVDSAYDGETVSQLRRAAQSPGGLGVAVRQELEPKEAWLGAALR